MAERAAAIVAQMRRDIGVPGLLEALLYPLLTPLYVLAAWARSLWAARALLGGSWRRCRGFHPVNAMTAFFYANQWLNLSRYGRHGRSPVVGLGDYPLSRWFHLSRWSCSLYARAGAACTLLGTLLWVCSHLVWLAVAPAPWVGLVVLLLFASSTAFAMAFTRQNYNILGWMWLPLALFATQQELWALAAASWVLASLASITAVAAAVPLMVVGAFVTGSLAPLAAVLPALAKLALHLRAAAGGATAPGARPAVRQPLARTLGTMGRIIGVVRGGVRYRRTSMGLRPFTLYFMTLYALACALVWRDQAVPLMLLAAFALFVVNQAWVRFADEQSLILLFTSVLAAHSLAAPPSAWSLAALAVALNPMPVFLGLCSHGLDRSLVRVRTRSPFDHTALERAIGAFVAPVPAGERVLFAFGDPRGVYENVFDGYRTLLELPLYVCAERGVHLFPDWHAVAETNHPGAPDFWGREPAEVLGQARRWGAGYAIVYTDSGQPPEPAWHSLGFRVLGRFDWGDWLEALEGHALWRSALPPCWHLLEVPAASRVEQTA